MAKVNGIKSLRISDKGYEKFRALAKKEGLSQADLLDKLLLNYNKLSDESNLVFKISEATNEQSHLDENKNSISRLNRKLKCRIKHKSLTVIDKGVVLKDKCRKNIQNSCIISKIYEESKQNSDISIQINCIDIRDKVYLKRQAYDIIAEGLISDMITSIIN